MINFLLKLNSKLNGTNFNVQNLVEDYFKMPTMIMGADVTHPSPNSTGRATTVRYMKINCQNIFENPKNTVCFYEIRLPVLLLLLLHLI
jgi:hypothetical protein